MASLHQILDINLTKNKYKLEYFIETGTGLGETIEFVKNIDFKLIQTCEINMDQYEKTKEKYNQNNIVFYNYPSITALPIMLNNIDGPALFYLDAHFPGLGYSTSDVISTKHTMDEILPLENELNLLTSWINITQSVVVIDDLRIYKQGNYDSGDAARLREILSQPDSNFLNTFLIETHNRLESEIYQGCVYYYPKTIC
jgi:hypothetical protein